VYTLFIPQHRAAGKEGNEMKHVREAVNCIKNAVYPDEGGIVVDLGVNVEGFYGWYTPEEAIKTIVDFPRIEFKPKYFWKLD